MRRNTAGSSRSSRRSRWSTSTLPDAESAQPLPTLEHLAALSDNVGVIQHAVEDVPNRSTGYCTDDIARAYIVTLQKLAIDPDDAVAMRIASNSLSYLHDAQLPDGRFHNFMGYDRHWLDTVGTHDSVGRALWALGYGVAHAPRETWRHVSKLLFDRGLKSLDWLTFPRSQAYAMLGLSYAGEAYHSELRKLAERLRKRYESVRPSTRAYGAAQDDKRTQDDSWEWFENVMTYDNARLPEAMLRAGMALHDDPLTQIGLRTLRFYIKATIEDGIFVPIGNHGWYERGGTRARFAAQPLEAVALVDAALAAYDATAESDFYGTAQAGLAWYYGRNHRNIVMAHDGGCWDGFDEQAVNHNMGAESTLAYLSAAYSMAARWPAARRDMPARRIENAR